MAFLGIIRKKIRDPLKPNNTIVLCDGPRVSSWEAIGHTGDAELSDNYAGLSFFCSLNLITFDIQLLIKEFNYGISNDYTSHKVIMKMCFNFFRFFVKVLELFECRRGNLFMTANRKFGRFTHS